MDTEKTFERVKGNCARRHHREISHETTTEPVRDLNEKRLV